MKKKKKKKKKIKNKNKKKLAPFPIMFSALSQKNCTILSDTEIVVFICFQF